MPHPSDTPLSAAEYLRMFRIIAATIDASDFPASGACMLFANIGAHLMRAVHGLDARAQAGVCSFRLSDRPARNLVFGLMDLAGRTAIPSGDNFHCWITCQGHIVDLMAPLYREMWPHAAGGPAQLPRQVFQKSQSSMAGDIQAPAAPGEFFVQEHPSCTREMADLVDAYDRLHPGFSVLQVSEQWYRRATDENREASRQVVMLRSGGKKEIKSLAMEVVGAW